MSDMRKITAFVPARLLEAAQAHTGEGVTETLRIALERLAYADWCDRMREARGRIKLDVDLAELREDRDLDRFRGRP